MASFLMDAMKKCLYLKLLEPFLSKRHPFALVILGNWNKITKTIGSQQRNAGYFLFGSQNSIAPLEFEKVYIKQLKIEFLSQIFGILTLLCVLLNIQTPLSGIPNRASEI